MKNEILIVDECAFDKEAIALMKSVTGVQQGNARNEEELVAALQEIIDKDSIKIMISDAVSISAKVMDMTPNLRGILVHGVGTNHIDVAAATERKIFVINQPGANARSVAELTIALLLAVTKKISQADFDTRKGNWRPLNFIGLELCEKTLGVIGLGNIGRIVAAIAKGFDMKVLYTDVVRFENLEKELGVQYVDKETLLRESDFVTLHVPLIPATKHYIGAKELEMMKKTAYLVNAARGAVIDEKALIRALQEKRIAGYA
ncbi:MAG: D-glycerate dehydrogenase, partial [Candidatus Lokiarchaeota archaeon]|nr:D-glycerate dehydrogenase [Candidatus Lokiarchaeota archaeon]